MRLEAEKDKILRQLSKDVDFDLSRARKIGTIGDQTTYVEDCGIDFDALLEAGGIGAASQGVCQGMCS